MKKSILTICLLMGMTWVQGCATIICGTTKAVNISSNPPEAKYQIQHVTSNQQRIVKIGTTPDRVILNRRASFGGYYTVTFEKIGYLRQTAKVETGVNGWFFGNILFGGIPGMVIDGLDGAIEDPKDVFVILKSE